MVESRTTEMSQPSSQSYSNVMSPKKEHAIIIDHVPDAEIIDYLKSLAKIIDPKRIRYISRISKNRVCCYLESKQAADEIINNSKSITVREHVLQVIPLITQNKRVIISNVRPEVPNRVIENELNNLEINLKSTITNLKANSSEPLFAHICSFRRQFYVTPEEYEKIPSVISIQYEGSDYYMYMSSDKITCFLCKREGHIAKNCCEIMENEESTTTAPPSTSQSNSNLLMSDFPFLSPQNEKGGGKRAHTTTDSESLQSFSQRINEVFHDNDANSEEESCCSQKSLKSNPEKIKKPLKKKLRKVTMTTK